MFKNPGYDFDKVMNNLIKTTHFHCLKYARIQAFFWSVFSHIQTKYGNSQSKSLYSVQTRENMGEKNPDLDIFPAMYIHYSCHLQQRATILSYKF